MDCRLVIAALLFGSIVSTAQDSLEVVSRTPLPPELRTQFGWGDLRVGCAENGNTLLALVPPSEKATHEIVALTPDATLRAWIDIEKVPGLDRAEIDDFAPGPQGEIYVIARRMIWERYHVGEPACALTITVDPSLSTVLLLLAPLSAAVYGALGGELGYLSVVLHKNG